MFLYFISLATLTTLSVYFVSSEISFENMKGGITYTEKRDHYLSQTLRILSFFATIGAMVFMFKSRRNRNMYQLANDEQIESLNSSMRGYVETQQSNQMGILETIDDRQSARHTELLEANRIANTELLEANRDLLESNRIANEGIMGVLNIIARNLETLNENSRRSWI